MTFRSIYHQGFARVAAGTTRCVPGDPAANAAAMLAMAKRCHDEAVALVLFPELCLSGYAIDDLLLQDPLLDAVDDALARIAEATADLRPVVIVGAPLEKGSRVYNCGVVIHGGRILGVAPKS